MRQPADLGLTIHSTLLRTSLRFSTCPPLSLADLSGMSLGRIQLFCVADWRPERYYENMVATRQQALEIASRVRIELQKLYGQRLRGVYLYGSAARDQLTPDSDIDIAIVLDKLTNRYAELKRTSKIGSDLCLETSALVMFLFVDETDFRNGRFSIHRAIKEEGIPA